MGFWHGIKALFIRDEPELPGPRAGGPVRMGVDGRQWWVADDHELYAAGEETSYRGAVEAAQEALNRVRQCRAKEDLGTIRDLAEARRRRRSR